MFYGAVLCAIMDALSPKGGTCHGDGGFVAMSERTTSRAAQH